MARSLAIFFGLNLLLCYVYASEWQYTGEKGQDHWGAAFPHCNGNTQSPIDVETKYVLPDPSLSQLRYHNYDKQVHGSLENNKHTVVLKLDPLINPVLSGGDLGYDYNALQLHFHWRGPDDNQGGSEHTVDGHQADAELHIVHMIEGKSSLDGVKDQSNGLAVLGVLLNADGDEDNKAYQPLFDAMGNITYGDSQYTLQSGPTLESLLPTSQSFYRYMGSLTTPPCYETVVWTLMQDPVSISKRQLSVLQQLRSSEKGEDPEYMYDNFRDVQDLGKRLITEFKDVSVLSAEEEKGSSSWHYHGAHGATTWPSDFNICGLQRQSPINVVVNHTMHGSTKETKLTLDGYDEPMKGSFVNNGHTVKLNFDESLSYVMSGAHLNGTYKAAQLHFHWGDLSTGEGLKGGAEHTVDGVRYAAEMHIVHIKENNANVNAGDAAAVLGMFIEVDDEADAKNTEMFDDLVEYIRHVHYTDETYSVAKGPTLQSILPSKNAYYRYEGSLTTPPCSEIVIWTLFAETLKITTKQFIAFQQIFAIDSSNIQDNGFDYEDDEEDEDRKKRSLKVANETVVYLSTLIRNNYRPEQNLNGRTVYLYTEDEVIEPEPLPALQIALYAAAGIAAFVLFALVAVKCCSGRSKSKTRYQAGKQRTESL